MKNTLILATIAITALGGTQANAAPPKMFAEPTCSCPPDSTLRMEASGNGYYKTGCWKGK